MREFAKVPPQIWISESGRKIKRLGHQVQLVSLYLLTSPHANMIGVYYLPISFIAHEIGLSPAEAEKAVQRLCEVDYCSYDFEKEYVWVHDMGLTQVGTSLKSRDHRVKNINEAFLALPAVSFKQDFFAKYADLFLLGTCEEGTLKPLESKKKENEIEKDNEKEIISSGKPDIAYEKQAEVILNFLNEKTKCRFRPEETNLKLIIARLKSGASADDCRAVIARKYRDWYKTDMQKYLRPATLFNATKFEQYLGECVVETDAKEEGVGDESE